jgi:hypothetical protein
LAFAEGGRGEDFFFEVAFGEELVGGVGLHGAEDAEVVDEIDVAFGAGEGGVVLAHALFPFDGAGFGIEAVGDAGVGDIEEVAAFDERGWHVGDAFVGAPDDVGIGDVASTVGLDGEEVVLGEAAGHVEKAGLFAIDDGGDELLGGAVHDPEELAGAGIVTGDAHGAGEDHLRAATDVANEGDAVAAGFVGAVDAPEFLAVGAGESDDVAVAVVVAVDDDFVFKDDGAGAEAVLAGEEAGAHLPDLFAAEIMRGDDDGAFGDFAFAEDLAGIGGAGGVGFGVVEEGGEDALAIGGGGAGGLAIEFVDAFDGRFDHGGLPEDFARGTVQGQQHALLVFRERGDDEEAILPDDGGGMPAAGQLGLPRHRAICRDGEAGVFGGAIKARPTPLRPVFGREKRWGESEEQGKRAKGDHAEKPNGGNGAELASDVMRGISSFKQGAHGVRSVTHHDWNDEAGSRGGR